MARDFGHNKVKGASLRVPAGTPDKGTNRGSSVLGFVDFYPTVLQGHISDISVHVRACRHLVGQDLFRLVEALPLSARRRHRLWGCRLDSHSEVGFLVFDVCMSTLLLFRLSCL